MTITRKEIEEENTRMLKQQADFRTAADYVTEVVRGMPGIERVVLFGSVAATLWKEVPRFHKFRQARVEIHHECGDLDLAVWVSDLSCLRTLQKAIAQALNRLLAELNIGVAHHQVDLFIIEPGTDRYLGNLCRFSTCPRGKMDCLVPGCGEIRLLKQYEDFTLSPSALQADKTVVLFDRNEPAENRPGKTNTNAQTIL